MIMKAFFTKPAFLVGH